jgi:HlyD family secretion protein
MSMVRKLGLGLVGLGLAGGLVWALWPQPMAVDLGPVTRDQCKA